MVDMTSMQNEILEDLKIEFSTEPRLFEDVLQAKIKNAIRTVKQIRKYPKSYTEDMIFEDMSAYYNVVRDLALYDYKLVGAEFHTSYDENGIDRSFADRSSLLKGVLAISNIC